MIPIYMSIPVFILTGVVSMAAIRDGITTSITNTINLIGSSIPSYHSFIWVIVFVTNLGPPLRLNIIPKMLQRLCLVVLS